MIVGAPPPQLLCAVRLFMDNVTLICTFIQQIVNQQPAFLYNSELRIEPVSDALQLVAASGGLVAASQALNGVAQVAVRHQSSHWNTVHTAMAEAGFLPTGKSRMAGFYDYQSIAVPAGYQVRFTDALDILQAWWSYKNPVKMRPIMAMLILHRGHWYAIQDLTCQQGTLLIHTLKDTLKLYPLDRIIWLQKGASQPVPAKAQKTSSARSTAVSASNPPEQLEPLPISHSKKIGSYLVEAALLTTAQTEVVLCDQQATGMRFGEILVKRGWLKEETIEFLMKNVILPQRAAARREAGLATQKIRRRVARKIPISTPSQSTRVSVHSRSKPVVTKSEEPLSSHPKPPPTADALHNRETLITRQIPDFIDLPAQAAVALHNRETLVTYDLDLEDSNSWDDSELV
ncbi:hypothetical protein C1752_04318 [Acaryochloris thomasi RCC1774]|uniref:Uncharacterized protein n=1 Tax=Acaryochloris thomasi RCC1774 TaxID=1764569 RepID=A0A2W1JP14_9CYAN|nr:hypothetical protein [Acaryochloris thomasi]PZD71894.1 hypothetical protein C1752_04318 [Acaryochloris thomasi RCC1774]